MGDVIAWTQASDCTGTGGNATATKTVEYTVTPVNQSFMLHRTMATGQWRTCVRPAGGGLWTLVTGLELTVVMQPTFTPLVGVAGSVTPLTFLNSTDMDFIVM